MYPAVPEKNTLIFLGSHQPFHILGNLANNWANHQIRTLLVGNTLSLGEESVRWAGAALICTEELMLPAEAPAPGAPSASCTLRSFIDIYLAPACMYVCTSSLYLNGWGSRRSIFSLAFIYSSYSAVSGRLSNADLTFLLFVVDKKADIHVFRLFSCAYFIDLTASAFIGYANELKPGDRQPSDPPALQLAEEILVGK